MAESLLQSAEGLENPAPTLELAWLVFLDENEVFYFQLQSEFPQLLAEYEMFCQDQNEIDAFRMWGIPWQAEEELLCIHSDMDIHIERKPSSKIPPEGSNCFTVEEEMLQSV